MVCYIILYTMSKLNQTYNLTEQKILNLLDELDQDRNKLFGDLKTSRDTDKIKEDKVKCLENLQKYILTYKRILNKEKEKDI